VPSFLFYFKRIKAGRSRRTAYSGGWGGKKPGRTGNRGPDSNEKMQIKV